MLEKYIETIIKVFETFGNPSLNPDKYKELGIPTNKLEAYYQAFEIGLLEPVVWANEAPRVKVTYNGNIDDLIDKINLEDNLESKQVIYITNEINNLEDLNKLKENYPDKKIIINWNYEIAFIDDVISAISMIDYFKSVVDKDLSPLEKITFVYDIVKSHNYNDYEVKYSMNSRHITKIVNNNYIVCAGYINILNRVLNEMGFNCSNLNLSLKDANGIVKEQHVRSLIRVPDEKYEIDSYYVFDPTWDSANRKRYYKIDDDTAEYSDIKKEGFKNTDTLALYNYFLVPLALYEKTFPNSYDEKIVFPDREVLDSNTTREILHSNQIDTNDKALLPGEYITLLYNVRLAEGYSPRMIPEVIQESLFVSNLGFYELDDIKDFIQNQIEKSSVLSKKQGYITFNIFGLIAICLTIITTIKCILTIIIN